MVTRILLDPRRDLPDGTTQSNPVTVTATPTGISESGQVVVLPTSLSFTIATSADVFQLPASAASWKWRLAVRDTVTNALLQQRTVLVPDVASIGYAALPDVDPTSLGDTVSHARNWDATFAHILDLMAGIVAGELNDAAVATLVSTPASATATALAASLGVTYSTLAQLAANPDQLVVGAITRSGTGAATAFNVVWPDGSTGAFVGTESTSFPGAIDAYTVTKVKSGVTVTFTQFALTRDANGAVVNRPAITVA